MSLEEAHGFFEYIIVLDAVNSRRRQSSDITVHVPFNKTSINVTGLNPQLTYTLTMRIAVQNERGVSIEGPTSIPIRIEAPCEFYHANKFCFKFFLASTTSTNGSSSTGFIIGLAITTVIALIVIIILVLVVIIFVKRKSKKYKFKSG